MGSRRHTPEDDAWNPGEDEDVNQDAWAQDNSLSPEDLERLRENTYDTTSDERDENTPSDSWRSWKKS